MALTWNYSGIEAGLFRLIFRVLDGRTMKSMVRTMVVALLTTVPEPHILLFKYSVMGVPC